MTTTTALPPLYAGHAGGDPRVAFAEARAVIEHAILHHPRTLQTEIGPSELGGCEHCVAARLAGLEQTDDGIPWLPTIGTAVHAWIEAAFIEHENNRGAQHTTGLRYLTEVEVLVGHIAGRPIHGKADLVDVVVGMTTDWKIVGATTLRSAKAGPSDQYRTQQHLYAKGLNDAGIRIDHVSIAYLPRNAVSLDAAVWWVEPYQPEIATAALDRANRLAANIQALRDGAGEAALLAWIAALPREDGCRDCARWADAPPSSRTRSLTAEFVGGG
ncbi:MAG: hypothetical protein H5T80_15360, partial [Dietzia sp.]|nr:hypothetical protein [Dietzia sp.]